MIDYHSETKYIQLDEQLVVQFRKDPRFGRWTIHVDGPIPSHLTGSYTSFGAAHQAAKNYYLNDKSRWATRQKPYKERMARIKEAREGE